MTDNLFIDFVTFEELLREHPERKYCFIIGSGASVSSGIPSGEQLMKKWLKLLKKGHNQETYSSSIDERIDKIAKHDRIPLFVARRRYAKYKQFDYKPSLKNSQDDYNNIHDLYFCADDHASKEFFLSEMDEKNPNIGYLCLSTILCNTDSNVVITTNFDQLVERAITIYNKKIPFVIGHEGIAEYGNENYSGRPRILKPHRDMLFGGRNRAKEIRKLDRKWDITLKKVLKEYIPIVVGYRGTDKDIVRLLKQAECKSIFWCHRYASLPNKEIQYLVKNKHGRIVETIDSDVTFFLLSRVFGPDTMNIDAQNEYYITYSNERYRGRELRVYKKIFVDAITDIEENIEENAMNG